MGNSLAYTDYYIGAYGKTIRIATQSKDWLVLFRKYIQDIFTGSTQRFDICQMPYIKSSDSVKSFFMVKNNKTKAPFITTIRIEGKHILYWEISKDEIETILGLIDGLLESDSSGHQYLASEDDGFVIELAYKED